MKYPETYLLKCEVSDVMMLRELAAHEGISMAGWLRKTIREAWYRRASQPITEHQEQPEPEPA